ncbi:MAG: glycosyltransferase family 4 protein [Flavobacteriales bacterium]|jgi:glycosyltransferase involved in cell wall biosynthesis|tara:strand:+ start:15 stop:1088 length:1074 start_codon:yes stop_codon:yes gene_type:complete
MKKVLIIGPFPDPISGVSIANKVVKELLSADSDFLVETINTSYPSFDEQIGKFSIKKFLFYLSLNLSFFKIFKNNIVYITPGQTFFGVLKYSLFISITSLLKKELIIHVHGNYLGKEYQSLKGFKRVLFYFLVSRFTKGIVLSNSLKHNLTPFLEDKNIFSLPNFAQDYLYKEDKKFVKDELRIFYLSNLMKEKGIFCLLNALKNLEKNNIIYKAKIAGNIDQKYSKEILNLFTELKNTEYIGIVNGDDKKNLLEWGNVFVLPTFYKMEGQPISILEAMATTNLVVTTNHAGISDVFQDKINGYFVEKNNENSIQKILSYLAANKSELKKIAEYNKTFFLNNFTVDIFKKNLLEIIK